MYIYILNKILSYIVILLHRIVVVREQRQYEARGAVGLPACFAESGILQKNGGTERSFLHQITTCTRQVS